MHVLFIDLQYTFQFSKRKLTQPEAQKNCSETYQNGTLVYFENVNELDNVTTKFKNNKEYWTGLVYNEQKEQYEFSDGSIGTFDQKDKIRGISGGGGSGGGSDRCVYAKKENGGIKLFASRCCDNKRKYFICQHATNCTGCEGTAACFSFLDFAVNIENNTWVRGNTKFISSVEHDISRVSAILFII